MNCEIINIGNELLIGQVVNTNASWMADRMNRAGFSVGRIVVIPDDRGAILGALETAGLSSSIVLVTGGLGPTKDDITKEAFCSFFNTKLVFHPESYHDVERLFAQRGMGVTELNRKQAELPESCTPISNRNGTAPGMWFERAREGGSTTVFVSMPGVPFEMKPMMDEQVIPKLRALFSTKSIVHKTILTQGIGESFLSEILEPWENLLPPQISLAYLPQPGIVRLRLSGSGDDEVTVQNMVDQEARKLIRLIPDYFFGYDDDLLEVLLGNLLTKRRATLSTAESCTGGAIAHLITSVPGSSAYFKGGVVAYSNEIKKNELGVPAGLLEQYGAVSREVVCEMAAGIRAKFATDYAIATSGIAGPSGGSAEKPVGLTWIAVATPAGVQAKSYLFGEDRGRNIRKTALQAMNNLRKVMLAEG